MISSIVNQNEDFKAKHGLLSYTLGFAVLGIILATHQPMEWFLVIANLLVVFCFSETRLDWRLAALFIGAILLRETLSFYNYYITLIPSADMDSAGFQAAGCALAEQGDFQLHLGSELFNQFIAFWYRLFGCSGFLTAQFSILAMTGFGVALLKIIRLLSLDKHRYSILFIALYIPTHILFSSLNLREPFQLLFFTTAILFALRLRLDPTASLKKMVSLFLLNIGLLGIIHNGLMFYSVAILVPLSLIFCTKQMKPLHKLLLFAGLAFLLLPILLYFSQNSVRGSQVLSRVLNGEIVDYINYYRAHLPLGRTQYIAKFDFSSLTNLCLSTANILFHYWFEPFPSRVESLSDLAVFFEVQCQTLLLLASLYLWFRSKDETKKVVTYLMLLYITLSLLWAAGTGNVGTAIRHHMLGTWIIILLGIPGFALWRNNLGASLYRIIMPPIKLR